MVPNTAHGGRLTTNRTSHSLDGLWLCIVRAKTAPSEEQIAVTSVIVLRARDKRDRQAGACVMRLGRQIKSGSLQVICESCEQLNPCVVPTSQR